MGPWKFKIERIESTNTSCYSLPSEYKKLEMKSRDSASYAAELSSPEFCFFNFS